MATTFQANSGNVEDGRSIAIDNLLLNCAHIVPGTNVLLVNETDTESTEHRTVADIETRARQLGARVTSIWTGRVPGPDDIPKEVIDAVKASDVAIFNHTMGGLLRLRPVPGNGIAIHNYASTDAILDSSWSRVPYGLWEKLSPILARNLANAHEWRITDAEGTDLRGRVPESERAAPAKTDGFSVSTFPIGTHRPTSAHETFGTMAIRYVVSSANHDVGTGFRLDTPVKARVEGGCVVDITGDATDVRRVRDFIENAGAITGQDPYSLSSWHAGVNPLAFTAWPDISDLDRWQTLVHNNPRSLHFHIVGKETPGEISLPIIDPTVTFDGVTYWDRGKFLLLDLPDVKSELSNWKTSESPFELNTSIGI